MKSATFILSICLLLAACRHPGNTSQRSPATETPAHFVGTPSAEEAATDTEIRRHLLGTWRTADDPRWAPYSMLTIKPDGSFITVNTNQPRRVFTGSWCVERKFLLLIKSNAAPFNYYGFHYIHKIDDHHLVCGVGMSVAGELGFTK